MPDPTAATPGYWRGSPPRYGGTGSMAGPASTTAGATTWTPTVVNLLILFALECGAYIALRWAFRSAHGG